MNLPAFTLPAPTKSIHVRVIEPGRLAPEGWTPCEIGTHIEFKAERLATYFFKGWSPLLEDALLVAGAVEFCDMSLRRPSRTWARDIHLFVPVHDLARWQELSVTNALHDALNYLTGDCWSVRFYSREGSAYRGGQQPLELDHEAAAVIPFSNGLDSCSVADLESRKLGPALIRIRLGTHDSDMRRKERRSEKFAKVPYAIKGDHNESSMRSRGFKFGVVSGLAAYLAGVPRVIMPESGQGAIGPAIAPLGQVYADYAIAGTLHLDHLAGLRGSSITQSELGLHIFRLARACEQPANEIREKLDYLLARHEVEWRTFLASLGPRSFLREWAS